MNISDILTEVLAMESSLLRSRKLAAGGAGQKAAAMNAVLLGESMDRVDVSARTIFGACLAGEDLRKNVATLRALADCDPIDVITLRRKIAGRSLSSERYTCD